LTVTEIYTTINFTRLSVSRWRKWAPYMGALSVAGWAWSLHGKQTWIGNCKQVTTGRCASTGAVLVNVECWGYFRFGIPVIIDPVSPFFSTVTVKVRLSLVYQAHRSALSLYIFSLCLLAEVYP